MMNDLGTFQQLVETNTRHNYQYGSGALSGSVNRDKSTISIFTIRTVQFINFING